MHLGKLFSKFDARCRSYNFRIIEINSNRTNLKRWEFNYLTEVLISDIWQAWCNFCRELILSSCRGTIARNGQLVNKRFGDNSLQRIGYEAKQANYNHNVTANGHLNFMIRNEPTWGDLNSIIRIVQRLQPSNFNNLVTTFGSFTEPKNLQKVRNACAHKNKETITDISTLSITYNFSKLSYATDLAWKMKNNTNAFAIDIWLYEVNKIADLATASS